MLDPESHLVVNAELAIPLEQLQLVFSGSSGPGGQHVNRSATRVTVRFHVAGAPCLSPEQRALLVERLGRRLDRDGVLQVHAQESRSQTRNRRTALERLAALLAAALQEAVPRRHTRPTAASVARRMAAKRRQAERKAHRRPPFWPQDDT